MTTYVLDASVAAKWFLPAASEPLSKEADRLLTRYRSGDVSFYVPDLFFPEFASVFLKAERHRRCSSAAADIALRGILRMGLPIFPSPSLIQPALQIARAYGRTIYDCIYVALAIETKTEVVTADEKLANGLPHMPVVWLGLL